MFWWLLLILALVIIYKKLDKINQHWKKKQVPHFKLWSIDGTLSSMAFRKETAADFIQRLYKAYNARYIGSYMFLTPTLLIKDIDLIKQITVKDFDYFAERNVVIDEDVEPLFGRSLFNLKGHKWRDMRSTLSPAFTSSKMRAMYVLISDCADRFVDHFIKTADPNEPKSVEMKDIFTKFTNDIIATCAFGIECNSLEDPNNEFYQIGKEINGFTGAKAFVFLGYMMCPALMKFLNFHLFSDRLNSTFRKIIKTTMITREREGIIRPDMIHLLMEARKGRLQYEEPSKSNNDGFATAEESNLVKETKNKKHELSDDDVAGQAVLFFIAGFDTSSNAMSFMSHELAVNEEVQRRLQEEIDSTLEECGGKLTYEALMKMKYLDMVTSEALRLWPPVFGIDRVCVKPYTIKATDTEVPVHLEKNDILWIAIYGIHRDPKHFPNPDRFDPERFSDENKHKIKPFSYLPFGVGPRNCIASRFALMQMKTLFVHLLSKFDLVVVDKTDIPLKLEKNQFNVNAENGFWLGLNLRKKK